MRPLMFLLSLALVLPGTALAAAVLVLGSGIVTTTPSRFFGVVLDTGAWLLPWGLLTCIFVIAVLLIGGMTARFRRFASSCIVVLAVSSGIVVLHLAVVNFSPEQLLVLGLAIVSALLGIWLADHSLLRPSVDGGSSYEHKQNVGKD